MVNINESIQFVLEMRKGQVAAGTTGAAVGAGLAAGINKLKQNEIASRIGNRQLTGAHKLAKGDWKDKLSSFNPKNAIDNLKDVASGISLKDTMPKHAAVGAAVGSMAGAGIAYANKKLKDRNKLLSQNKDLKTKLTHQANQAQLTSLQKQNQHGMQTNTSHY